MFRDSKFLKIVLISIVTLGFACSAPTDQSASQGMEGSSWTLEEITSAREGCSAKSAELGAIDPLKLAMICSCIIEDAAKRWSPEDWIRNATAYTQAQVKDGTVEKCRVSASPNVGGTTWSQAEIAQVRAGCVASAKQSNPTGNESAMILGCGCVVEDASKRWDFPDYIKNEYTYTKKQLDDGIISQCMAGNSDVDRGSTQSQQPPPISIKIQGIWESSCILATKNVSIRGRWDVGAEMASYRLIEYKDNSCGEIDQVTTDVYSGNSDSGVNGDYKIDLVRVDAFVKYADPISALAAWLSAEWGYNKWPIWTDQKVTDRQRAPGAIPQFPLNERRYDLFRIVGDRLYQGESNDTENRRTAEKRPKDANMFLSFSKVNSTNRAPIAGIQPELSLKIGGTTSNYPKVIDADGDDIKVSCVGTCPEGLTVSENMYAYSPIIPGATTANMMVRDSRGGETSFTLRLVANKEFQVYRDQDGDGFGSSMIQIVQAPQDNIPAGYVTNGTDCNDSDAQKWRVMNYTYRDSDGDGVTVTSPGSVCAGASLPREYLVMGNGNDCADGDATKWQTLSYNYRDIDGDGFTVPTTSGSLCVGMNLPATYKAQMNGNDCADGDATKWQTLSYSYRDMDGDGFTVPITPGSLCVGMSLPATYKAQANGDDCDDRDITRWNYLSNILNQSSLSGNFFPIVPGSVCKGQLSSGSDHSCVLTNIGGVKCWGSNLYGQLGDGTTLDRFTPTSMLGLNSQTFSLGSNYNMSCILIKNGDVYCTQSGGNLQKINNGLSSSDAIALGYHHTCSISKSGQIECWGSNDSGQLGNGTTTDSSNATRVTAITTGVFSITAGGGHTCAIVEGGDLYCWGLNNYGQIGDGTKNNIRSLPTKVTDLNIAVRTVTAGASHTCALSVSGLLYCWGSNSYGKLGNDGNDSTVPTQITGIADGVVDVVAGYDHTCSLDNSGSVKCWGKNQYGQLGDGTTMNRSIPTQVVGLSSGVVAIVAGFSHTCAIIASGGIKCWGYNFFGNLGNGFGGYQITPTAVQGLGTGSISVSSGDAHTCTLLNTGEVKCWGINTYGQLGADVGKEQPTPSMAFALPSGVVKVVTGLNHTCSIINTGALKCWGNNSNGQIGDGTTSPKTSVVI